MGLGAKRQLSEIFYNGQGVEKDLVQAVYWGSEAWRGPFWEALEDAAKVWNGKAIDSLGCDFNRLTWEIGKGLYQYETINWQMQVEKVQELGVKCLHYYCETIDLQQGAIVLFLLFWNKTTGVKEPGQLIGKIVWEGRYDCLVKKFGKSEAESGVKR